MVLINSGHDMRYGTENICRVFFPNETVKTEGDDRKTVFTSAKETESGTLLHVSADIDGTHAERDGFAENDAEYFKGECEKTLERLIYSCLSEITGYVPPWGILTGVRPSKLMTSCIEKYGGDGAKKYFTEKLFVSEKKTKLAFDVAKREKTITSLSRPDSFSLYIAIPFCPSRCSYCSFVSHSITGDNAKKLIPDYVRLLKDEIKMTGETAKELKLKLESVYIGGGTPTSLSASEIDEILCETEKSFDLSLCREFTVEAGRPDTVTDEKLKALKTHGVTRISINPQTTDDDVLERIGRKHTNAQTESAFYAARKLGFDNINTDVIAGLDGDTPEGFKRTLDRLCFLSPESITVHTLALKRSSTMVSVDNAESKGGEKVEKMLDFAQEKLNGSGYFPYYMYRQSRCIGNFENVGWSKDGYECLYNVFMMEECHTVLSCGAGAVTKLRRPSDGYIERIFNFKYPYEYTGRFGEICERKKRIAEFYGG
ncbi:MAG: coproporphyrinogen dehydrogenase HemZ [Clostridiales bacterium]|nr:coproporphyrinogen dehydrogenase HemZ [Clostridiales bacterium]